MPREFNITGPCVPELHYMADISTKLEQIERLVMEGRYFTMNRPRQYGKTTILHMLEKRLSENPENLVLFISFEGIGDERFKSETGFIDSLLRLFRKCLPVDSESKLTEIIDQAIGIKTLDLFADFIGEFVACSQRWVILIVDEVDKSSNNQLFLSFLGVLRHKYLQRVLKHEPTFHSVILAGVHDVKSLKLKLRPDEEQKYNSPWNIAVNFEVSLDFSPAEIAVMLSDYARERDVRMNENEIAERLYYYSAGYPFLVSGLCRIMDIMLNRQQEEPEWKPVDIDLTVKHILRENNTNFESLIKNLENNHELSDLVFEIIMDGAEKSYNRDHPLIDLGESYCIFRPENGKVKIHNRIYEQRIYNYFSSKVELAVKMDPYNLPGHFVTSDGKLDFTKVLIKFQEFMREQYTKRNREFIEENGRLLFLAFVRPIINGQGYDFKEVQISEEKRLDVVITYLNQKFTVELKIWRGEKAHKDSLGQLADYLERTGVADGFLVIFDFRRGRSRGQRQERVMVNGKSIFIVWV